MKKKIKNNRIYKLQKILLLRFMLSHPAHILSMGLGSGLIPFMPGTFGSLLGWVIYTITKPYLCKLLCILIIIFSFVIGIYITNFTERQIDISDPDSIVWDEIVAIWLILLINESIGNYSELSIFLIFRFFDICKPIPIYYIDKYITGGIGIMIDDIIAALMGFFSMFTIQYILKIIFSVI